MENNFDIKIKYQAGSNCSTKVISLTTDPTVGELKDKAAPIFD